MGNSSYVGDGHKQSIYARRMHDGIQVAIGAFGRIPDGPEVIVEPRALSVEPARFLSDLLANLPDGAVMPVHVNEPDKKVAGSGAFGFYLTVDHKYESRVKELLNR